MAAIASCDYKHQGAASGKAHDPELAEEEIVLPLKSNRTCS